MKSVKFRTIAWSAVGVVAPGALVVGLVSTLMALPTTNRGILGFQQLELGRVFFDSLWFSAPAAGFTLIFVFFVLRAWRLGRKVLVGLFFCTLFGFPATAFGCAVLANVWLDGSRPMTRIVIVTAKPFGRHQAIEIASWSHPGDSETLYVDAGLYTRIVPGQTRLAIRIRAGLLGYQWVARYAEVPQ